MAKSNAPSSARQADNNSQFADPKRPRLRSILSVDYTRYMDSPPDKKTIPVFKGQPYKVVREAGLKVKYQPGTVEDDQGPIVLRAPNLTQSQVIIFGEGCYSNDDMLKSFHPYRICMQMRPADQSSDELGMLETARIETIATRRGARNLDDMDVDLQELAAQAQARLTELEEQLSLVQKEKLKRLQRETKAYERQAEQLKLEGTPDYVLENRPDYLEYRDHKAEQIRTSHALLRKFP